MASASEHSLRAKTLLAIDRAMADFVPRGDEQRHGQRPLPFARRRLTGVCGFPLRIDLAVVLVKRRLSRPLARRSSRTSVVRWLVFGITAAALFALLPFNRISPGLRLSSMVAVRVPRRSARSASRLFRADLLAKLARLRERHGIIRARPPCSRFHCANLVSPPADSHHSRSPLQSMS